MYAVGAAVMALVQASPALALVDERLNGDGTGKTLGVDNPLEAFVFIGTFGTIWALYSLASGSGDLDEGDNDDDTGLSLS